MANDLDDKLEDWFKSVEKKYDLTAEQKSKITGAGAAVFAETLKKNTPVSSEHYNSGRSVGHTNWKHNERPRKTKHLRDSITFKPGYTAGKIHSGNTTVGFDDKYQAMVARYVNNGTAGMSPKEIKNMHFIEKSQLEAKNAVLKAEAQAFKEVIK